MQTGRATTEVIARVAGYVAVILATKAAPATFLQEDIEGQVRKKPLNPVPVRDLAAFDPVPHPRWLAVTRSRIMHIAQLCHAFALAVLLGAGAALGGIAPPLPQRGTLPARSTLAVVGTCTWSAGARAVPLSSWNLAIMILRSLGPSTMHSHPRC